MLGFIDAAFGGHCTRVCGPTCYDLRLGKALPQTFGSRIPFRELDINCINIRVHNLFIISIISIYKILLIIRPKIYRTL